MLHTRRPQEFLSERSLGREATEGATILQVINCRHFSFLTALKSRNNTSISPEAKFCAVGAQPWVFVLLHVVSLLGSYCLLFCWRVSFSSACAIQPDLHVIRNSKFQPIKMTQFFGTSTECGKVKKTRQLLTPKKQAKGNSCKEGFSITPKKLRYVCLTYVSWIAMLSCSLIIKRNCCVVTTTN